jgi:hypothetical protein
MNSIIDLITDQGSSLNHGATCFMRVSCLAYSLTLKMEEICACNVDFLSLGIQCYLPENRTLIKMNGINLFSKCDMLACYALLFVIMGKTSIHVVPYLQLHKSEYSGSRQRKHMQFIS